MDGQCEVAMVLNATKKKKNPHEKTKTKKPPKKTTEKKKSYLPRPLRACPREVNGTLALPMVRAELGPNGASLLENPAGPGPVLNPQSWDGLLLHAQEGERRECSLLGCGKRGVV